MQLVYLCYGIDVNWMFIWILIIYKVYFKNCILINGKIIRRFKIHCPCCKGFDATSTFDNGSVCNLIYSYIFPFLKGIKCQKCEVCCLLFSNIRCLKTHGWELHTTVKILAMWLYLPIRYCVCVSWFSSESQYYC